MRGVPNALKILASMADSTFLLRLKFSLVSAGTHFTRILRLLTTVALAAVCCLQAATFGTVVTVRGHVSDIAKDPVRNIIYAANFTANRVEVFSTDSKVLRNPYNVAAQPSAVTVSPNGRYLVVGHYAANGQPSVALTVIDLNSGAQRTISHGTDSVLAAAFGNGSSALIVTSGGVLLLDPGTGELAPVILKSFSSTPLTVPWATFPAQIISGSANVSGDGNVIYAVIDTGSSSQYIRYSVTDASLVLAGNVSSPAPGPRAVSVDQTGDTFLAGWTLLTLRNSTLQNLAQFPYPSGVLFQGGHTFDPQNNLIYGQLVAGAIQQSPGTQSAGTTAAPGLLQMFDADNLTVRETYQIRENLAGKALLSGDSMYAVSDSGLTVFPIGAMAKVHRVKALQEDLLFQSNGCNQGVLSQYLDLVDPGGGSTDFVLKSPSPGVSFSSATGSTPARVKVFVDPAVYQDQKGTASVLVQITSISAVNQPTPVRVLINTRNPDQQGAIYNVPGTVVDVLADPNRNRFYVLRQDQNQVIAFDGTTMNQLAVLRTGNTPVQMAISQDQLLVTNDNSQIINVYDLSTLTASTPIYLPPGTYARSIAVANGSILATSRVVTGMPQLLTVDVPSRIANIAPALVYTNAIDANSVLTVSPTGDTIFMAMPDGTVAAYDTYARLFFASRKDVGPLSGAYAALSDDLYMAGNHVFAGSLVPMGDLDLLGGVSSGVAVIASRGLLTSAPVAARNGVIQRFSMAQLSPISPARTAEQPIVVQSMTRIPVGQTGQTILPFTRTLAPLAGGQMLVQLSTSGFTTIPGLFDAPVVPPAIKSVSNAADQAPTVSAGGLISVWGNGFSDGSPSETLPQATGAAPVNVCLYANSINVPLLFISPGQVNAQLPFSLAGSSKLVLSNARGSSSPFTFSPQALAPAVFRMADGTPAIFRASDGKVVTDATPIHLDEKFTIYLTGMGPVSPGVAAGTVAPASPLSTTDITPKVYLGPVQLFTLWSGLAPGLVGVYQINVQVPFRDVSTGSKVQLAIIQGEAQIKLMVPVH